MSEGEYISLGWFERDDVDVVVQYLRDSKKVSTIGLWGRSMGAITALMHADRDPSIAGIVVDSAFSSLKKLAEDLVKAHTKIPGFIISGALAIIKSTIKSKANFDINKLSPIDHVQQGFIPALFVAAKGDDFIKPEHTQLLYSKYAGDKNLILVDGDHNSARPSYLLDSISIFFYNTLQCSSIPALTNKKEKKTLSQNEQMESMQSSEFLKQQALKHSGNKNHLEEFIEDDDFEEQMRMAMEMSLNISNEQKQEMLSQQQQQQQQQLNNKGVTNLKPNKNNLQQPNGEDQEEEFKSSNFNSPEKQNINQELYKPGELKQRNLHEFVDLLNLSDEEQDISIKNRVLNISNNQADSVMNQTILQQQQKQQPMVDKQIANQQLNGIINIQPVKNRNNIASQEIKNNQFEEVKKQ